MSNTTTVERKCAQIGSISHGTFRDQDLLEAFANELEWQIRRNGEYYSRPENFAERDRLNAMVGDAWDCFGDDGEILEDKQEEASELINERLMNALDELALPYCYFGAHCGDGTDFGFWPMDIKDIKGQVGFVSTKEQDYPSDGFVGEWLHINERGNCTLYVRDDKGQDKEIWGIV